MPRGIPNAKPFEQTSVEAASPMNHPEAKADWTSNVRLNRHYRPADGYEIVGYHKPEVKRKNAAGVEFVAEAAEFVKGELAPPPFPGVGFDSKIWAGTVITLPKDEAKTIVRAGIAALEFED